MLPSYTPPYPINMVSVRRPLRPVGAYGYFSPTVPQLVRSQLPHDVMNVRKRPAPVSCDAYGYPISDNASLDYLHMKRTGPFNETKIKKPLQKFFCETCGIEATSQIHLDTHINGSKHRKKVEKLQKENEKTLNQVIDTNNKQGLDFFCFVCHLDCGSANQYNLHVQGRKHKNKLKSIVIKQKLEQMSSNSNFKVSFFDDIRNCYEDEYKTEEDIDVLNLQIVQRENDLSDAFQLSGTVPRMKEFYCAVPLFNPSTIKDSPEICKHDLCLKVRALKFYESYLNYQIEDKKHLALSGNVQIKNGKKVLRKKKRRDDDSSKTSAIESANTSVDYSGNSSLPSDSKTDILPSSCSMKTEESFC